ncbi:hypothetical protein ACLESO_04130 [Pyxidicoccus sp. 3LG]
MRILFPAEPLSSRNVDDAFAAEAEAARACGWERGLVSYEALTQGGPFADFLVGVPRGDVPETAVYRGWMLRPEQYATLLNRVVLPGGLRSRATYLLRVSRALNSGMMRFMPTARLEDLGRETTFAELHSRLHRHPQEEELRDIQRPKRLPPGKLRIIDGGVDSSGDIDTGKGPYVVLVDGPLKTSGHLDLWTYEYLPGLVIVRGDLQARTLSFGNGARVFVDGSVFVDDWLFGQYGDHNAVLSASGELRARASFLGATTFLDADGGVRSLVYASRGGWEKLKPDIENEGEGDGAGFFDPAVLDRYGDLDFPLAIQAAREGRPLFLPGVEERFPARLTSRKTK